MAFDGMDCSVIRIASVAENEGIIYQMVLENTRELDLIIEIEIF